MSMDLIAHIGMRCLCMQCRHVVQSAKTALNTSRCDRVMPHAGRKLAVPTNDMSLPAAALLLLRYSVPLSCFPCTLLQVAMTRTKKLCAVIIDTLGREVMVRRPCVFGPDGWPAHLGDGVFGVRLVQRVA